VTRLIAACALALTLSITSTVVAQEELVGTWEQVVGIGEGFEGSLRLTLAADHTFEIVVQAEFKPELLEVDAGSFGVDEDGNRAAPAVPTQGESPTDEAPPGETATDVAPPRETPTDVAPPGETPTDEGPSEETPATEPAPAETPTDEAPGEETPVNTEPVKEAPVNDEPRGEEDAFELGEELFYFALYAEGFELEIVARGSWEAEDELLTLRFEEVEIGIDGGTVSEFLEASARDLAALLAREQGIDDDEYAATPCTYWRMAPSTRSSRALRRASSRNRVGARLRRAPDDPINCSGRPVCQPGDGLRSLCAGRTRRHLGAGHRSGGGCRGP
jgi:hypothetical protein